VKNKQKQKKNKKSKINSFRGEQKSWKTQMDKFEERRRKNRVFTKNKSIGESEFF
jgi:hypothetical protein